ncbi:hypothetical protein ACPXBI_25390, partial [Escherichia coli]|uniref:hypothetical protein n=1 Tax=Escherichia coli TaxID=562 RepID=UPI003CE5894A
SCQSCVKFFAHMIFLRMDTAQGNNADLILQSLPHLKIREHLHDLPSGDTLTPAAFATLHYGAFF